MFATKSLFKSKNLMSLKKKSRFQITYLGTKFCALVNATMGLVQYLIPYQYRSYITHRPLQKEH